MKNTSITIIMQNQPRYAIKITINIFKIRIPLTRAKTLQIPATTSLLLVPLSSPPLVGLVSIGAVRFFGTSWPHTLIGRENDGKTFERKVKC
ncbi:MAG: hypothetical protein M3261_07580 [Thermoproteota archaeon]|nr:hypothetical protein [Thermoproteota archaeon]